jgi:hypothetical protein
MLCGSRTVGSKFHFSMQNDTDVRFMGAGVADFAGGGVALYIKKIKKMPYPPSRKLVRHAGCTRAQRSLVAVLLPLLCVCVSVSVCQGCTSRSDSDEQGARRAQNRLVLVGEIGKTDERAEAMFSGKSVEVTFFLLFGGPRRRESR